MAPQRLIEIADDVAGFLQSDREPDQAVVGFRTLANEGVLAVACVTIFAGTWIDKGLGMIAGGFTPSPLHEVN